MRAQEQKDLEAQAQKKSEWVYQGKVVGLRKETLCLKNGDRVVEIVHHRGAVVIVPIDSKGRILLIKQWRRAVDEIIIELPAGTLEEGEDPLASASRELQEETGFFSRKITPLGGFFSAPGYSNEYLHLFLAEDLHESQLEPDEDEGIDLFPVSVSEAKEMIGSGVIQDAKTVAGILRVFL